MALRMRGYVPQRQMLPLMAASMSASVGSGFCFEQRGRGHDLAGLAVAALRDVVLDPRGLQRMQFAVLAGQAFDRGDLLSRPRR